MLPMLSANVMLGMAAVDQIRERRQAAGTGHVTIAEKALRRGGEDGGADQLTMGSLYSTSTIIDAISDFRATAQHRWVGSTSERVYVTQVSSRQSADIIRFGPRWLHRAVLEYPNQQYGRPQRPWAT